MADTILLHYCSEKLCYENIINWLLKRSEAPAVLEGGHIQPNDFVSYFLSFLRDSCAVQKQDFVHSGLTPRKNLSDGNRNNYTSRKDVNCAEKVTPKTSDNFNRRKPRNGSEYRSRQKLSLGNFLKPNQNDSPENGKLQTPHTLSIRRDSNFNLLDEESFPPIGSSSEKKRNGFRNNRRIAPTPILKSAPRNDAIASVNAAFNSDTHENDFHTSFNEERLLLKMEKTNLQSSVRESLSSLDLENQTKSIKSTGAKIKVINPNEICSKRQIDKIVKLYAALLLEQLVPCLSMELYFIFQLLTIPGVKHNDKIEPGLDKLFLNAANCIYFASQVLYSLRRLILLLDSHTIRLLSENCRLQTFSPLLINYLKEHSNLHISSNQYKPENVDRTIQGVAFQTETDNKQNFVNEQEFILFKKKRDLFYSLLREWESNHDDLNWSMETCMGSKIKSLVAVGCEPTSLMHLARLFQAQLVVMCKDDYLTSVVPENEDDLEDIASLKKSNPEKMRMLEKRFLIPRKFDGQLPPSTFPLYQEFFKCFIRIASSSYFNFYLGDVLSTEIRRTHSNLMTMLSSNLEKDCPLDCADKSKAISMLMTLKLLAKFLGLVVFLPYSRMNAEVKEPYNLVLTFRNHTQPMFDFLGFITSALKNDEIYLVLFWMVDFLSLMDHFAPHLQYYQTILNCCYKAYTFLNCNQQELAYSQVLFRFVLEWLFQVIRSKHGERVLVSVSHLQPMDDLVNSIDSKSLTNIDVLQLVDVRLLYLACPYLKDLKSLLVDFSRGISCNSSSTRKIKPISTTNNQNSSTVISQQLQLKLEENFFHNQPASIRRIVDFLSEQISSNVIKHTQNAIIPPIKIKAFSNAIEIRRSLPEGDENYTTKSKLTLASNLARLAGCVTNEIRSAVRNFSESYCKDRICSSITLLLAEETSKPVREHVNIITNRICSERINDWINNHVTENVYYKEMLRDVEMISKEQKTLCAANGSAATNNCQCVVLHPSKLLLAAKELAVNIWSLESNVNTSQVLHILTLIHEFLLQSFQSCTQSTVQSLFQLSVDILMGLVVHRPELISDDVQRKFLTFYCSWSKNVISIFKSSVFYRNFYLFCFYTHSSNRKLTWAKWTELTRSFLEHHLISEEIVINCCRRLLKLGDLPPDSRSFLLQYIEKFPDTSTFILINS